MEKKLVNLRCYVAIGNGDYCDTSFWNHTRYAEVGECDTLEYTLETWEDAYSAVDANKIRNASTFTTFFGNKPAIEFSWGRLERSRTTLTERTFKPVRVKWQWEEVDRVYTMKDLADILPDEQFCEWLKDRGITMVNSL